MSRELDRTVRAYIEASADPDRPDAAPILEVIPGNVNCPRPKGTYASLLMVSDTRVSIPAFRRLYDGDGYPIGTMTTTERLRTYSLQFYRSGGTGPDALEFASRFIDYTETETGLLDAQTAFGGRNGAIWRIGLLRFPQPDLPAAIDPDSLPPLGGSFMEGPDVEIKSDFGSGASARAILKPGDPPQPIDRIDVISGGSGYIGLKESPVIVTISGGGEVLPARATARGYGFIVQQPLEMTRLDEIAGDSFEERIVINLPIKYGMARVDHTGRIDINDGETEIG